MVGVIPNPVASWALRRSSSGICTVIFLAVCIKENYQHLCHKSIWCLKSTHYSQIHLWNRGEHDIVALKTTKRILPLGKGVLPADTAVFAEDIVVGSFFRRQGQSLLNNLRHRLAPSTF